MYIKPYLIKFLNFEKKKQYDILKSCLNGLSKYLKSNKYTGQFCIIKRKEAL